MLSTALPQSQVNSTPAAIVTVIVVLACFAVMAIIALRNFGPNAKSKKD